MSFIDKAINKVVKWESITVSPDRMASLTEDLVISKCNEDELKNLRKGLKKTWVLAVGSGCSIRFYPSSLKDAYITMDFNLFTHTLSQITLRDTPSQTEYFLPKGKQNRKQFQELVLTKLNVYLSM